MWRVWESVLGCGWDVGGGMRGGGKVEEDVRGVKKSGRVYGMSVKGVEKCVGVRGK